MTEQGSELTRRTFLKNSAVATAGVALGMQPRAAGSAVGSNDRVRMGFIGVGNRGCQLLRSFMSHDDVDIVALCDVYEPYRNLDRSRVDKRFIADLGNKVPPMGENVMFKGKVDRYQDFRRILDRKDIDAVCIATPDHWHAIQTIMACEAGKDVYVEKPLSITILEGRRMIEAARRYKRVVQVGINRRGSAVYQEAARLVREGAIGKVSVARAYRVDNMYPDGIGNEKPVNPPEGLDWDLWLGPRAYRPFQYNITPYKFRWWKDFSSQNGNWGVHYIDAMRWMMGEEAPKAVTAHSTKAILKDDRTIPDTSEITYEFASGALMIFGMYEACGGRMIEGGEIELLGTEGNLVIDTNGYTISHSKPGQFQTRTGTDDPTTRTWPREDKNLRNTPTEGAANLIANFLDCIRTRKQPICDLETGHRSNTFSLLANIGEEVKERIEWDADKERITNITQANSLLHYEYRKPWKLG